MQQQPSTRGQSALAGLEALEARVPPSTERPEWSSPRSPRPPQPPTQLGRVAPRGVQTRIRRLGPLVALIVPAILGAVALIALHGNDTTTRGLGGFVAAVLAVPLLPAFGVPMRGGTSVYLAAIAASAVLWFAIGAIAAFRSTRSPAAGWARFWGEYLWLAMCVWVGVLLSLVAANLVIGRVLL